MIVLAQTFPSPIDPSPWTNLFYAIGYALAGLVAFLTLWRRMNGVSDRQEVAETNTQTLATVAVANAKAINASPGPNVPPEVVDAAKSICADASVAKVLPIACSTDPVQPPQPRIQT